MSLKVLSELMAREPNNPAYKEQYEVALALSESKSPQITQAKQPSQNRVSHPQALPPKNRKVRYDLNQGIELKYFEPSDLDTIINLFLTAQDIDPCDLPKIKYYKKEIADLKNLLSEHEIAGKQYLLDINRLEKSNDTFTRKLKVSEDDNRRLAELVKAKDGELAKYRNSSLKKSGSIDQEKEDLKKKVKELTVDLKKEHEMVLFEVTRTSNAVEEIGRLKLALKNGAPIDDKESEGLKKKVITLTDEIKSLTTKFDTEHAKNIELIKENEKLGGKKKGGEDVIRRLDEKNKICESMKVDIAKKEKLINELNEKIKVQEIGIEQSKTKADKFRDAALKHAIDNEKLRKELLSVNEKCVNFENDIKRSKESKDKLDTLIQKISEMDITVKDIKSGVDHLIMTSVYIPSEPADDDKDEDDEDDSNDDDSNDGSDNEKTTDSDISKDSDKEKDKEIEKSDKKDIVNTDTKGDVNSDNVKKDPSIKEELQQMKDVLSSEVDDDILIGKYTNKVNANDSGNNVTSSNDSKGVEASTNDMLNILGNNVSVKVDEKEILASDSCSVPPKDESKSDKDDDDVDPFDGSSIVPFVWADEAEDHNVPLNLPFDNVNIEKVQLFQKFEIPNILNTGSVSGYSVKLNSHQSLLPVFPHYDWRHHELVINDPTNMETSIGALNILPIKPEATGIGFFGNGKLYEAKRVDKVVIGDAVGKRLKLRKGISLYIPDKFITLPDNEIIASYNSLHHEMLEYKSKEKIQLSLEVALLNNRWRMNNTLSIPEDLINDFSDAKPVFGKILSHFKDYEEIVNLDGLKFLISKPVGGYSILTNKKHIGPFKGKNTSMNRLVAWDMNGWEINQENIKKGRALLLTKYKYVFYHCYQSRHTLHWHLFNEIEDAVYSMACDLWTDRNSSVLRKGFPFELLLPICEETLDISAWCVAFYGLGIRISDPVYIKGLRGELDLKSFSCPFNVIREKLMAGILLLGTCDIESFKVDIVSDLKIEEVSILPWGQTYCLESGFIPPQIFGKGGQNKCEPYSVYPSTRIFEVEPHPVNRLVPHNMIVSDLEDIKTSDPFLFELPNMLCYKKYSDRGRSKTEELFEYLPLKDIRCVCLGGDYKATTAMYIKKNYRFCDVHIFDVNYIGPSEFKVAVGDITEMPLDLFIKFDFIFNDLCSAKGPLEDKIVDFYIKLYDTVKVGTKMLLKLKSLGTQETVKLSQWVIDLTKTTNKIKLIKPPSSRLRNSECYLYVEKGNFCNQPKNIIGTYYYKLRSCDYKVPNIDVIYDSQNCLTPLCKLDAAEFSWRIINGSNVELFSDSINVIDHLGPCFSFSKLFKVGNQYLFQGIGFSKPSVFLASRYVCEKKLHPKLLDGGSTIPFTFQKNKNENSNIIANCLKEQMIRLCYGKVIDIGCGNSGIEYNKGARGCYPAAFDVYEGYDPAHPVNDFKKDLTQIIKDKIMGDTALFIQSIHHTKEANNLSKLFDDLFSLGYSRIIYNTFVRAQTVIDGRYSMWYMNNGTEFQWCGEKNKIVNMHGEVIKIDTSPFTTYCRTFDKYYDRVINEARICVVTKANRAPVNTVGMDPVTWSCSKEVSSSYKNKKCYNNNGGNNNHGNNNGSNYVNNYVKTSNNNFGGYYSYGRSSRRRNVKYT